MAHTCEQCRDSGYTCVQCHASGLARDEEHSVCSLRCGRNWASRRTLAGFSSVREVEDPAHNAWYWGGDAGTIIAYHGEPDK